jgi:hypothetical protein
VCAKLVSTWESRKSTKTRHATHGK